MAWPPDAETVSEYNTISQLLHNSFLTLMSIVALIYNRNGPNWIKGFIAAIAVSAVAGLVESSLRICLILYFPSPVEH